VTPPRLLVLVLAIAACRGSDNKEPAEVGRLCVAASTADMFTWEIPDRGSGATKGNSLAGPNRLTAIRFRGKEVALPNAQFVLGTWKHYAGTLDATVKRLYVDGVERATSPAQGTRDDAGMVRIGCDKDVGSEIGHFSGIVDDVVLYDRPLTPDEVADLAM
jgi:hypothetical protein